MLNHRPPRSCRRWRAAAPLACATLAAAIGCSGELTGVVGSTNSVAVGGGPAAPSSFDAALLGRWRRVVVFAADDGTTNSSETTWTFAGDGSALRTVVSRNVTLGFADAVSAAAIWRTEGGTVVITYRPPDSGTVRFPYLLDRTGFGDVLHLGGQAFARVGL